MPLPPAADGRQLRHQRLFDLQIYARGNGEWEVDAWLRDTKTRDVPLGDGVRKAGTPIHEMLLRLVIDQRFQILQAGSETRWMPYEGLCGEHGDAYAQLVGLNLMRNFRADVRERLSGIKGCTHITELAQVLPTAVVQAFAGDVIDPRGSADSAHPPPQLDRCHALRHDGEAVRMHYPRWYRAAEPDGAGEPGRVASARATASDWHPNLAAASGSPKNPTDPKDNP
ncbi:MAG: DUF2889 domain-containing protein [Rubrivivax sp.]